MNQKKQENQTTTNQKTELEKQLLAVGIGIGVILLANAVSFFIDFPWVLIILFTIAAYLGIVYYSIRKLGLRKKEIHSITRVIALTNAGLNSVILYFLAPELLPTSIVPSVAGALIIAWIFTYVGVALFKTAESEVIDSKAKK